MAVALRERRPGRREPPVSERQPGVSIAIPVHNGENYLRRAIDSILAQTYTDLEVVVCDNASTDATESIAREVAAADPRVRYHRNPENIGAPRNFNLAFNLTTRRYFKWAAHDDELEPGFIEACVEVLDRDPAVVAAFSRAVVIRGDGTVRKPLRILIEDGDHPAADRRFADVIRPRYGVFHVWALMRAEAVASTALHGLYPGEDRVFVAEIALRGRLHTLDAPLFRLRDHPQRSVKSLPTIYERAAWHDPARRGRARLPHWRIGLEYLRAIRRARLPRSTALRSYLRMLPWLGRDGNWVKLLLDLAVLVLPSSERLFIAGRRWLRRRR
jgi:glycosyltransferase involved in cell wall biosynthesis